MGCVMSESQTQATTALKSKDIEGLAEFIKSERCKNVFVMVRFPVNTVPRMFIFLIRQELASVRLLGYQTSDRLKRVSVHWIPSTIANS